MARRDDDDWIDDELAEGHPRHPPDRRFQIILVILLAVAVIAVLFIGLSPPQESGVLLATDPEPGTEFVILKPIDGGAVGPIESVSGRTPHTGAKHYVVVTPVQVGQAFVQPRARVSDQGTWVGTAHFGAGARGFDEEFIVFAIATYEALTPGHLTRNLKVLAETPHITVRRTKN
jgi:hypothetical protein